MSRETTSLNPRHPWLSPETHETETIQRRGMTTTASDSTSIYSETLDELPASFAAKARPVSFGSQAAPASGQTTGPTQINWLEPTTKAINRSPYQETNIPDGRTAPKPEAAAALPWILINALEDKTIVPTAIIPTSRGGAAAEWHVVGHDLEIECDPDGTPSTTPPAPTSRNTSLRGPLSSNRSGNT